MTTIYLAIEMNSDKEDDDFEMEKRHLISRLNDGELPEVRGASDITPAIECVLGSVNPMVADRKDLEQVAQYAEKCGDAGQRMVGMTCACMAINTVAKMLGHPVRPQMVEKTDAG